MYELFLAVSSRLSAVSVPMAMLAHLQRMTPCNPTLAESPTDAEAMEERDLDRDLEELLTPVELRDVEELLMPEIDGEARILPACMCTEQCDVA